MAIYASSPTHSSNPLLISSPLPLHIFIQPTPLFPTSLSPTLLPLSIRITSQGFRDKSTWEGRFAHTLMSHYGPNLAKEASEMISELVPLSFLQCHFRCIQFFSVSMTMGCDDNDKMFVSCNG